MNSRRPKQPLDTLPADRSGVTALEFALCLPVFLLVVSMVIETGLLLFTQQVLDASTRNAARLVRTGQMQQANAGSAQFGSALCTHFSTALWNCADLVWTVQAGNSYADLAKTTSSTKPTQSSYVPGGPNQPVLVQVFYTAPTLIPFVGPLLSASGNAQLVSTIVFQNESYQ